MAVHVVLIVALPRGGVPRITGTRGTVFLENISPPILDALRERRLLRHRAPPVLPSRLPPLISPPPVAQEEEAEEHAAEVGKMCDVIVGGIGRVKFDGGIARHKIFCLDGNGRDEQHDALVGVEHAEGKQHAVARARCADGGPAVQE